MTVVLRRFAGPVGHADNLDQPIRVAHLTDQHVGRVTPFSVQMAAVQAALAQNPDLIAITGDFVAHSLRYLDQLEALIAAIDVPVFAVLGNHDHWTGPQAVRACLRHAGVEVLDNAWTSIEIGHQRLQIVGLDDAYTGNADRQKALKGLDPRKAPTLGLSHIAEEADGLWEGGVPLVLSGHTHGGQVDWMGLPRWTVGALAGHRYVHGLYGDRRADRAVYVSAGIGAAVVPFRAGDRGQREVACFELGRPLGGLDDEHHV
ncbi:MAG: metallophosphoesterase, partial [Nitrosopumilus sp.]|nr:metallophosphoesterase [Nitrosopumilus sp.]